MDESLALKGESRAGRKRKGFWIEQLLEEEPEGKQPREEPVRAKRSRKGREAVHCKEERSAESPPLDEANWLRAGDSTTLRELHCELENWETWERFDQLGTEMIITKSGRRMFPVLRLRFSGTRPGFLYFVFLDLVPVERQHRFRYAYNKSQWQSAGKADKAQFGRLYLHCESPFTGEQLAQSGHTVSFDKAKLTNNPNTLNPEQLLLNSMHKYRPRVHVLCVPKGHPILVDPPRQFCTKTDLDQLAQVDYKSFTFPRTTFVAVTAYQNQLVTQKKIELNPFAKGFRDQKADGAEERPKSPPPTEPSPSDPPKAGFHLAAISPARPPPFFIPQSNFPGPTAIPWSVWHQYLLPFLSAGANQPIKFEGMQRAEGEEEGEDGEGGGGRRGGRSWTRTAPTTATSPPGPTKLE